MSTIFLGDSCRLASYGANSKGAKSRVRIEIDCQDGASLGFLLDDLRRIDDAQRAAEKQTKRPARLQDGSGS